MKQCKFITLIFAMVAFIASSTAMTHPDPKLVPKSQTEFNQSVENSFVGMVYLDGQNIFQNQVCQESTSMSTSINYFESTVFIVDGAQIYLKEQLYRQGPNLTLNYTTTKTIFFQPSLKYLKDDKLHRCSNLTVC